MKTNKEYYEFDKDDALRFASSTGIKTREKNDELQFLYCPYCHGGKSRDKNTFSINLRTGQFNCLRGSCGALGNMITLAKDFSDQFQLKNDVSVYYNIGNVARYRKFKKMENHVEPKQPAIDYMASRGISKETTYLYEITTNKESENEIVFPFKDEEGNLEYIKYRKTDYKKGDAGSKEWCEKSCKPILFGMNHCEDYSTLVITEGQIDSMSCKEAGIKNPVSVPSGKNAFTWKPNCWNFVVKFDEIVVFGDCENGSVTLSEISTMFRKRVRVVREEDYKGCKDANELLLKHGKQALIEAVDNAEVKMSASIKNLASIESKDLTKLPTIKTGYPDLDKSIMGGFHLGELIVLTGKCGEGKSTFASMCIANSVNQGYNSFCYSGELNDYNFKAWLDMQIAGKSNLTNAEINRINEWYNNRIFIYDNCDVENQITPFDAMKEAASKLNCKFIIVDNLMTAMSSDTSVDLYRQQSSFVKDLAAFAKSFDVVVLLVAHPRKNSSREDLTNDDISGSGDITNLASVVIHYQRKKDDENKSVLKITKNRNNGITKSIDMEFNPESKRILQVGQQPFDYMNFKEEFVEVDPDEDIPFD